MTYIRKSTIRLPPGCGELLKETILFNPYQDAFQKARRQRFCLNCKTIGSMDANCAFTCPTCKTVHTSNLTAPRVNDTLLLVAGRGSGKTLIGAHAGREEMMAPNSIGWVMSDTFKRLHDSTFPTLVGLIDPVWVKRWDPEHMEITLTNNAKVAFRSLEDPERARGPHGVTWGWFDEAAFCAERAYDVFTPTLIKAAGITICTTTPVAFDWTYERIEQLAARNEPGYWCVRFHSEENPLFRSSPVMMAKIERARRTMSPEFFAQEYQAERTSGTGLVYNFKLLESQTLNTDDEVRKIVPEWPNISSTRKILVGLDEGADHPFGAVEVVITDKGLVVIGEYLERMQAISQHLAPISQRFALSRFAPDNITWAANKNSLNLRLEFGVKGIAVSSAESKHDIGIQRVQSWLYTKQLFFIASRCPMTLAQMKAYRFAENTATDGQKKKEQVFKLKDELPDALRYLVMAFPELPDTEKAKLTPREELRWNSLNENSRHDIENLRAFNKKGGDKDLAETDKNYPVGEFWSPIEDDFGSPSW
jgi:terminase large subunit-like protein